MGECDRCCIKIDIDPMLDGPHFCDDCWEEMFLIKNEEKLEKGK